MPGEVDPGDVVAESVVGGPQIIRPGVFQHIPPDDEPIWRPSFDTRSLHPSTDFGPVGIERPPTPTRRPSYSTSLRDYSTDASKVIGFIPPRPAQVPTFTRESIKMERRAWFALMRKHDAPTRQPYFGVELECYPRQSVATSIKAIHDVMGDDVWVIFKRDSSVRDGMEIVTAPMTLVEHQKRWPMIQEALRKTCRAWGLSNCGLHVHISRGDNSYCWELSQLHLAKMVYFIHGRHNWTKLQALGGRQATSYCQFMTEKEPLRLRTGYTGDRGEALNLKKAATLELRFFQGATRVERILMAVEFAACLREFVQNHSVVDCQSFDVFTRYAQANRKLYPHLVTYLLYVAEKGHNLGVIGETSLTSEDERLLLFLMDKPTKQLALKECHALKSLLTRYDEEARALCTSRKVIARLRQLEQRLKKGNV